MRAGLLRLPNLTPLAADRDLLRRFADDRDEAAFAELVRRHGPLVLAVCRRVVSDTHLADDAFQATFVVLARKAATAGVGARLSTWLHSVAVKVSLRARTMAGRRAKRETLTAAVPDTPCGTGIPACADDTAAVLDEEIAALPEHLRAAVVLCELRGIGRRDAAKELGVAEGTLSSRLAAARKRLAGRLRARGVAPAVGIFSAISVPTDLAAAAVAASTGKVELSPHIVQLVSGGLHMTLLTKLKLAAVAVVFAVLATGGFGGRGNESAAAPVPKDLTAPGVIWLFHPAEGKLVGHSPDGKTRRTVILAGSTHPLTFLGITPDGQHALVAAEKGVLPKSDRAGYDALHTGKLTVHLWPLAGDGKPADTGIGCQYWSRYVISRDGKTLIVSHDRSPRDPDGVPVFPIKYETIAYDLATFKGTKRTALPSRFALHAVLADGDRIVTFDQHGTEKRPLQGFHLLTAGSDKPRPLTGDHETDFCEASPDGTKFLVTRQFASIAKSSDSFHRMFVIDRDTGTATPFAPRDSTLHARGSWSPDGKRVVYEWLERGPQELLLNLGGLRGVPVSRGQVVVADADGKTETVLLEFDGHPSNELTKTQEWLDARPRLVGWAPTPRRTNAPLPKVNEDTMGLTASMTFDKKEVMLGEPTYFTFTVNNPTDSPWQFEQGGDYRNRLGRPNSFTVIVRGPDGKAVPQPDSGWDFGGISTMVKLPANGKTSFHPLFLPHWATFEKPGEYTVTVKRKVGLVPADVEDGFRATPTPVTLSATAKVTVTPADAKQLGSLIAGFAKLMLDGSSDDSESATKKLLAIRDPRVIPHFITLAEKSHPSNRYAACEALGRFKTDEAFAALKAQYATIGADLRESATTLELAETSADGVRHAAVGAIAGCGHPDALPFVWKAIDDRYYGVRLTVLHKAYDVKSPAARTVIATLLKDPHESVRNEAKRYTELLAKEKK